MTLHLMKFLEETGHLVEGEWDEAVQALASYEVDETDPVSLIGYAVHSYLSSRPRAHFFTDGKLLFTSRDQTLREKYGAFQVADLPRSFLEDALREHEILMILAAKPEHPCDLYALINGHLRVRQFGSAFAGPASLASTTLYDSFIREVAAQLPAATIQADERAGIARRLARNRPHLERLIGALHHDRAPLPAYAASLEASLAVYAPKDATP